MKINQNSPKVSKEKIIDFLEEFYYMFERLRIKSI
jgi:hypothetical protein